MSRSTHHTTPIASRLSAGRIGSLATLVAGSLLFASSATDAHVSISGSAFAGRSQIVNFTVGHGCAGLDTTAILITLPPEVTTVRGLPSPEFGEADVIKDEAGIPLTVAWEKESRRPADDAYYQLSIRIAVPSKPFETLYFPVTQTCRDAEGIETVVEWNALPGDPPPQGGEEAEPAAALSILPQHFPGWNRYTVASDIIDLSVFDNAEIVWVGNAAYSKNPLTAELIAAEPDVTALIGIQAGAEIWVKY